MLYPRAHKTIPTQSEIWPLDLLHVLSVIHHKIIQHLLVNNIGHGPHLPGIYSLLENANISQIIPKRYTITVF